MLRFLFGSPEKPEEKRQSHGNPPQKCESQNNPIIKDLEIIDSGGDDNLGSNSVVANYADGYPAQSYDNLNAQAPRMNQNKPQIRNVKKIANEGDLNMGTNSGVECNYEDMNQQPHNPFTQADWGVNEPIIEGSDEISNKGKINMGSNSGITISKGKRAAK